MPHRRKRILPITLSILIIIGTSIAISLYYLHWEEDALASSKGMVEVVENYDDKESKDLQTVIHEAQKHVVQIEAIGPTRTSVGSGFVYNNKGDIITNAHVVKNADDIFIKTSDASTYPGALIGISKTQDVAVIRVPQLRDQGNLEIDPSFEANIGEEIIAVGSPQGHLNTFTDGIISQKGQNFTLENYEYKNLYQVSANITQGNSGGPLIHKDSGLIIGINSAANREGSIGFSIPISSVYDLIQMWSDKADNEELSFEGDPNHYQTFDEESLKNDATYLINYFYDTLNVRDYFAAYSLLGSNEQIKRSYQEFRELIVSAIDIKVKGNMQYEMISNDRIQITVKSDHKIRKDEETMEIHHYETKYTVGYENDQLKILSINRELLSKTEEKLENEKPTEEDEKA
ncbi:S1C family serine protease [Filobacillus milosensis]|nr:trypsin-like peptidase domain-containing protein [Filobacillus milosensis]